MRLFGKKKAAKPLENVLAAFSLRLVQLEREMRNLKLDYLETYDKTQRLMSRVAKRAALDNPPLPPEPDDPPDEFSKLDDISAGIMRRRAAGGK